MKQFFRALLSDQGDLSMTRFLSLLCIIAALTISVVCLYRGQPADSIVGLVGVFLASGFGGKVAGAFAEKTHPVEKEKE